MQGNKLTIHKKHITHNYSLIHENYHSDYPLYAIVKSNAYGHGLYKYVSHLYALGHRHFGVFHLTEAIPLRKHFTDIHIMVMGDFPEQDIAKVGKYNLEIGIFNEEKWATILHHNSEPGHFHIMLESGLNRMGIQDIETETFLNLVKKSQEAGHELSFYSHISAAPVGLDKKRVEEQYRKFERQVDFIKKEIASFKYLHFYNSANLPFHKQHKYGARVGLLLYGYSPIQDNSSIPWLHNLKPVMEYRSWIMQVKTIAKGEYIGYGLHYCCTEDKRIGYIPIGYADGFFRTLGNRGKVLTRYGHCRIIGIVNMNLIAIDLSDYSTVKAGDEVLILGSNSIGSLDAMDHARIADTIPYEVLTSLGNQLNYGIPF